MFRQVSTVALVVMVAVGGLAMPGCKPLPKEIRIDLGNGIKLETVLIPAGEFMMGATRTDTDAKDDEKPQHRVRITKAFYLGKYPVTQEQWQAVMGSNPSHFKAPKNPVEMVIWDDCQVFLKRLNDGVDVGKFQLPSEAQWEYACRAGSTTRYCFGDDQSRLGEYAWYQANSDGMTHPVGEKKPNPCSVIRSKRLFATTLSSYGVKLDTGRQRPYSLTS